MSNVDAVPSGFKVERFWAEFPSTVPIHFQVLDTDLVAALRSRDIEVVRVLEVGLVGKSDEEQLGFAAERRCILYTFNYTFNVSDFYRLHAQWMSCGREHGGMILVPQQQFSVGEQLRRILQSSLRDNHGGDAKSGRVPQQLGITN